MKYVFICCMYFLFMHRAFSQDTSGVFIKDTKSGCAVWFKYPGMEDSVSWSGGCKQALAEGEGTLIAFHKGKEIVRYTGSMKQGKPHGTGKYSNHRNVNWEGNFSEGEYLNIKPECLAALTKNVISESDSTQIYVGDHNRKQLYYHAILPKGKIKGTLILMPGTWETTEHAISSTKQLIESAYDKHIAVLVLSINQRLALNETMAQLMNTMLIDAIKKYQLPADKMIIGGWSMGGLFSLRYTEMAYERDGLTAIKPIAVFSCDGPCDLENIYHMFKRTLKKKPTAGEPSYGIRELEKFCGGSPETARSEYIRYSCFSESQSDGGNAKYLSRVPVRIYCDVDPNWWLDNRGVDMYDMNAIDQTAMILKLKEMGNTNAEFINAFGKGYRIEGNRHPHSWSILDPDDTLKWILKLLE